MPDGALYSRGLRLMAKAASALRENDRSLNRIDLDGLRRVAAVSVRGHRFISALCLVQLVHRPYYGPTKFASMRCSRWRWSGSDGGES